MVESSINKGINGRAEDASNASPRIIQFFGPDIRSVELYDQAYKEAGVDYHIEGDGKKELTDESITGALNKAGHNTHVFFYGHGSYQKAEGREGEDRTSHMPVSPSSTGDKMMPRPHTVNLTGKGKPLGDILKQSPISSEAIIHVTSCYGGSMKNGLENAGITNPFILHAGSKYTTLIQTVEYVCPEIAKFISRFEKLYNRAPNALETFEFTMLISPETLNFVQNKDGKLLNFKARSPKQYYTSEELAQYQESQLTEFYKFREDNFGKDAAIKISDNPELLGTSRQGMLERYRQEDAKIKVCRYLVNLSKGVSKKTDDKFLKYFLDVDNQPLVKLMSELGRDSSQGPIRIDYLTLFVTHKEYDKLEALFTGNNLFKEGIFSHESERFHQSLDDLERAGQTDIIKRIASHPEVKCKSEVELWQDRTELNKLVEMAILEALPLFKELCEGFKGAPPLHREEYYELIAQFIDANGYLDCPERFLEAAIDNGLPGAGVKKLFDNYLGTVVPDKYAGLFKKLCDQIRVGEDREVYYDILYDMNAKFGHSDLFIKLGLENGLSREVVEKLANTFLEKGDIAESLFLFIQLDAEARQKEGASREPYEQITNYIASRFSNDDIFLNLALSVQIPGEEVEKIFNTRLEKIADVNQAAFWFKKFCQLATKDPYGDNQPYYDSLTNIVSKYGKLAGFLGIAMDYNLPEEVRGDIIKTALARRSDLNGEIPLPFLNDLIEKGHKDITLEILKHVKIQEGSLSTSNIVTTLKVCREKEHADVILKFARMVDITSMSPADLQPTLDWAVKNSHTGVVQELIRNTSIPASQLGEVYKELKGKDIELDKRLILAGAKGTEAQRDGVLKETANKFTSAILSHKESDLKSLFRELPTSISDKAQQEFLQVVRKIAEKESVTPEKKEKRLTKVIKPLLKSLLNKQKKEEKSPIRYVKKLISKYITKNNNDKRIEAISMSSRQAAQSKTQNGSQTQR